MMFENIMQSICEADSYKLVDLGYFHYKDYYIFNPIIIIEVFDMMLSYRDTILLLFYDSLVRYLDD